MYRLSYRSVSRIPNISPPRITPSLLIAAGDIKDKASTVVEAGNSKSLGSLKVAEDFAICVWLLTESITRSYVVNNSPYRMQAFPVVDKSSFDKDIVLKYAPVSHSLTHLSLP